MTPSFCWVFLLALVGRARSVPDPIVVDACALLCNPGAETESERARDKTLYPRYPKVNCHPQSVSDSDQAWRIASHCLKLCNEELSVESEVNCFALRSSLGSNLGCYCEALTPLSPNTMRLHESWRLNFLVKELANDIMTVILDSPLDMMILCEIHAEIYTNYAIQLPDSGKIVDLCKNDTLKLRPARSVDSNEEDSVLDKDAVEEIVADEENKNRVAREVKNSEHSKENYDKHSKNPKKNELETETKKNKDKKIGLGKKKINKDKDNKDKDNVENNKKVEKDVTSDSGKDKVKDDAKSDTKPSENNKEDSKNDNEKDNAKEKNNAKSNVENNEGNATNNAKNNEENNKEKATKDKRNVEPKLNTMRYAKNAQNDKKLKEDITSNSKTNDVKNNSKNETKDNAKNEDKNDSKESNKMTNQAENAKNDEERNKRDTYQDKDPIDYIVDYDNLEMMNDQARNDELQKEVTTKEGLLELMKTSKNDGKKSKTTDQAENAKNNEEKDKRNTNELYRTDRTGYDEHEMMNNQAINDEEKYPIEGVLVELVKTTNHLLEVLRTLLLKLDETNNLLNKPKEKIYKNYR